MGGRSVLVTLVIAAALAVPAVAAARPFYGTVGPGSTITLKRANGTTVNHASPGARKFVISDQSSGHNFHLLRPGRGQEDRRSTSSAAAPGRSRCSVGTYKFRCDAHPKTMRGSFGVS